MDPLRRRIRRTTLLLMIPIAIMVGLVVYAPTLYQLFCQVTGYGGTVQVAAPAEAAVEPARRVEEDAPAEKPVITVYLDANVSRDLPWRFRPMQTKVEVRLGEPVLVFYEAENLSDRPTVGQAVFNVAPFKAAPYFFKTECFCFTEERLDPGERAEMPVQFFVDEALLEDPNAREVRQITLSYTFYPQDADPEMLARARDLAEGSKILAEQIRRGEVRNFRNDAPRR